MGIVRNNVSELTRGERIRFHRNRLGLPRRVVAEKVGVSIETVRLWEADATSPRGEHLDLLAELFGVDKSEISVGEEYPRRARAQDDAYPSLRQFLSEFADDLADHEVRHLRGHTFASGDPGFAYWAEALMRYRRHERMRSNAPTA